MVSDYICAQLWSECADAYLVQVCSWVPLGTWTSCTELLRGFYIWMWFLMLACTPCENQNSTFEFWQRGLLFSGSCLCSLWYPGVLLRVCARAYWWFECWREVWGHCQNNQRAVASLLSWSFQTLRFVKRVRIHSCVVTEGWALADPVCRACPLAIPTSDWEDLIFVFQAKGLGYAISTTEELKVVKGVAESTGIILDPVYRWERPSNTLHRITLTLWLYHTTAQAGSTTIIWLNSHGMSNDWEFLFVHFMNSQVTVHRGTLVSSLPHVIFHVAHRMPKRFLNERRDLSIFLGISLVW